MEEGGIAMLGNFFSVPWNFKISHDRLGQGLMDDVTTLTL